MNRASEVRKISIENSGLTKRYEPDYYITYEVIEDIYLEIEKASSKGNFYIEYTIPNRFREKLVDTHKVFNNFIREGFTIERYFSNLGQIGSFLGYKISW